MSAAGAMLFAAGTGGGGAGTPDTAVTTSTGEAVLFWILAVIAVIAALGMVASKRAVYSALLLAMTMIIMAVFYIAQGALFLGVVQIVVYTGAVMMLFLFVLMLVGISSQDSLVETLRGQRAAAVIVGLGFGALLVGGIGHAVAAMGPGRTATPVSQTGGNVDALADLIFTRYLWAFEMTGALLITATVGAMVLAHRERLGPAMSQRERSRRRFRYGNHVTPMPSPGVYARDNAVDAPARLPDGSYAAISVSPVLRASHAQVGVSGARGGRHGGGRALADGGDDEPPGAGPSGDGPSGDGPSGDGPSGESGGGEGDR